MHPSVYMLWFATISSTLRCNLYFTRAACTPHSRKKQLVCDVVALKMKNYWKKHKANVKNYRGYLGLQYWVLNITEMKLHAEHSFSNFSCPGSSASTTTLLCLSTVSWRGSIMLLFPSRGYHSVKRPISWITCSPQHKNTSLKMQISLRKAKYWASKNSIQN